ncbi:MAG TPA: T9SS type A sorting domain-containing protein [Ferruginibacter sp.]|nr:T9SS type A sorting domain-containing protein [Ferruginibacter sp.]
MKVFLLALSLFFYSLTQAATYYISPTGNDATGTGTLANPWRTLFKATSTVTAAGNTIHVLPGTYTETQESNLAVGVSLEGEGIANSIILSNITGQWTTLLNLSSGWDTNGNQTISGITFNGQYVSEANYKTWWGIHVSGRSNVIIHDCRIINFYDRGVNFDGNTVFNPLTDPGHYATGNKFYNNTMLNTARCTNGYGAGQLNIGGQQGMEIYNNTLIQDQRVNFKNGWPIKYWENGWLKGVKIYNNTLKKAYYQGTYPGENGDWDFAIELFNISGLEIANNQIQGCIDLNYNYKGTYNFCAWIHHNVLDHPTVNTNFESGIILEFATESVIIEDNIINNSSTGIQFNTRGPGNSGGYNYPPPTGGYSALTNNIIRRNLFSNIYRGNGTGIGIFSEGTNDPYINGLYIYNNTIVAKPGNEPWWGIDFSSQDNGNCSNIHIRNNIFTGFAGAWIVGTAGAGNTNINGMTLTHNNGFGNGNNNTPSWPGGNPANYVYNNNLAVNPLFVGSGYYTLQAASPCIDAGVNIGLPYNGTAPDMGYAEYASASNIPPTANAGPDQTITLPTNSVTLSGSGTDPDGTVTAYLWTKIAGPAAGTITSPTTAGTTVTGLVQGTYRFELRVTDNAGAFGRDTMQVTVNASSNIPPTANAGPDQTITLPTNAVTLAGSGTDPDGTVTAYLWTKIAGPAAGTITSPATAGTTVTGLVQGTYRFELRVTDNGGAFGRDTMQVTVNASSNIPPVANAGADQTITLPTNTVTLFGNGVDPDGTITAYLWTKIAGPAAGTITTPNAASTTVTGLVQGVYRFELRVTDNAGAFGRDTVQVTVNAAIPNNPPTANAGPNQTITLPTNFVILSGSGTDTDGTIAGYLWTKIAGPAAGTITNPTTAATSVTGLTQGVYQFELRVTDNGGASGRDTVQVTVNPSASNIPPTANAGANQTITLPATSVILSGSGTDPDGIIVAYLWTKVSGPAAGTITNPNVAATSVTGLVVGTYQFELRVTDNGGASGRDTVQVTVNPGATNTPPTANAGPDQTIALPTNAVILSGSGTDPDGTVVAYLWTKIAGPAAGAITNPNVAATAVTGMVAGTYRFELRVTDNNGAFGRDTMQVIVNATPNTPPTANAGPDQTITLPTNSVILSGSGTDPNGTVTAYLWTKISGPAAGTITNPNVAATSVTGLVVGTYQFELRVTDNNGAFGRDTMRVIVNPGATNTPPSANAGPDQTIVLPNSTVILSGSGIDPDGTITAYLWTQVSGPAAATITNPNTAATSVTGLVQGIYLFELRVTDNSGAFGRDTVRVTVNPTAANMPPSANAGPDQTIDLPNNTIILSGSGTDPDGTVVAYLWTRISGPAATITNPATSATSVTGLVLGIYQFELRVTDNNGAVGRDTVLITVNAANIPPAANAGPDQVLTLPTNNGTLSGSGTDTDGTIAGYEWQQLSGPSNNVLSSTNTATTSINNLVEGVYVFELTVTDNKGATGKDIVTVLVASAPSQQTGINDANVYPNPVVDFATLDIKRINANSKPTIIIADMSGKLVYAKELNSTQQNFTEKLDLRILRKGMYVALVQFTNGERRSFKLIKQ